MTLYRPAAFLAAILLTITMSGCGDLEAEKASGTLSGTWSGHDAGIVAAADATSCGACHSSASHYGGVWIDGNDNPNNRAQYMGYSGPLGGSTFSFTIDCNSCHASGSFTANSLILKEYAESGHGDVSAIPWTVPEYGATCQRCHTSIGFANFVAGNTAVALTTAQQAEFKAQMQVLTCNACHSNVLNGALIPNGGNQFTATWTQNSVTASVAFPNAGSSNLCIRCHSARRAGANITNTQTTTAHYLPAATIVFGGTANLVDITATANGGYATTEYLTGGGYEFAPLSYANARFAHKDLVGMIESPPKGPCVGCHMGGEAGHTWEVVGKDESGTITELHNTICVGCHDDMTVATLNAKKSGFNAAVEQLAAVLLAKGFYLNPANGTFYRDAALTPLASTTPALTANQYYAQQAGDSTVTPTVLTRNLQGAAFNLWLFQYKGGDQGAYVHNVNYAKKLLFDTLDYLDGDTVVDGNPLDGVISLADPVAAAYLDGNGNAADGVQRP